MEDYKAYRFEVCVPCGMVTPINDDRQQEVCDYCSTPY